MTTRPLKISTPLTPEVSTSRLTFAYAVMASVVLAACETKLDVQTTQIATKVAAASQPANEIVIANDGEKLTVSWDPEKVKDIERIFISQDPDCKSTTVEVSRQSLGNFTASIPHGNYYLCVEKADDTIIVVKPFKFPIPSTENVVTVYTPSLIPAGEKVFTTTGPVADLVFKNSNATGNALVCSVSPALPAGLTLSLDTTATPHSCKISGTPTTTKVRTTYTVTAIGADATSRSSTVSFEITGGVPTLSFGGATGTNGTAGMPMSITPTELATNAANFTGCAVKEATTPLPAGLTVNASTCEISGTPTTSISPTTYTLVATNASGVSSDATVSLTVNAGVPTLSFSTATGTTGAVGTLLSVLPSSLSANGSALSNCAIKAATTALPAPLAVNAATCEISGIPTGVTGAVTYTLVATNGIGNSLDATVTITIAAGRPVLDYAGATGTTGSVNSAMTVTPSTLTTNGAAISACGIKIPTTALPSGLSVHPTTCVISGTPSVAAPATTYTLNATNSAGTSSDATVSLTVNAVAPTLSFAGATGTTGSVGTAMSVAPTTLNANGANITACGIKAATTALPGTLTVNATTCVISGTPSATLGSTSFTLVATNSAGTSADATVSLTINAGVPTLSYSTSTGTTGTTGSAMSITPSTLTANGAAVSACAATTALPAGLSIHANTCVISGTPSVAIAATNFTINATNSAGASANAVVNLTINAAAPVLSYASSTGTTGNVGALMTVTPSTLTTNGANITSCGIKAATTALPANLTVHATTCVISGTPSGTSTATAYTVVATNSAGTSSDATVTLTIDASNSAPTNISLTSTSILEGLGVNAVVGTLSSIDANGSDTHTYSFVAGSGDTDNGSFNISGSSLRATGNLNYATKSSYAIRVRSSDNGGLTFDKPFTITVTQAGGFSALPNLCAAIGSTSVTALGAGTITDPYIICSKQQLGAMKAYCDANFTCGSKHFLQMADIDMNGQAFTSFKLSNGVYDGNHYKISNLTVSSGTDTNIGFIDVLQMGVLRNLTFETLVLTDSNTSSASYVAVVSDLDTSKIINVHVTGTSILTGGSYTGGLAATSTASEIYNSSVDNLSIEGISGSRIAGGVAGYAVQTTIKKTSASGTIANPGTSGKVGGILGYAADRATPNETVTLEGVRSQINITMDSSAGHTVGGIVGSYEGVSNNLVITDSIAIPTISSCTGCDRGAIIGLSNDSGSSRLTLNTSYFDSDTFGSSTSTARSSGGLTLQSATARTTAQMQSKADLAGLTFKSIWYVPTASYPILTSAPGACSIAPTYETYSDQTDIGAGTPEDPYLICNVTQYRTMDDAPNSCNSGSPDFCAKHFALGADIDFAGVHMNPIGKNANFTGTFDGRRHLIKNFKTGDKTYMDYVGLFDRVTISGTNGYALRNIGMTAADVGGCVSSGILVARPAGTGYMSNVFTTGTIECDTNGGLADLGGLAGDVSGSLTIRNAYSTATVLAKTTGSSPSDDVGGLIGNGAGLKIFDSYYAGNMTVSNSSFQKSGIGGIGGTLSNSNLTRVFASGTITNQGIAQYVGGLVGQATGTYALTSVYSKLEVISPYPATTITSVGGLAGSTALPTTITNSYAAFDLNNGIHAMATNALAISGSNCESPGPPNCAATGVYFDQSLSSNGIAQDMNSNIFGQSNTNMKLEVTFSGWDFTNTWKISGGQNDGYPRFVWQP